LIRSVPRSVLVALLVIALLDAGIGVARVLTAGDDDESRRAASPSLAPAPVAAPTTSPGPTPTTSPAPTPTTSPAPTTTVRRASSGAGGAGAAGPTGPSSPPDTTLPPVVDVPVTCQFDLALADSPNAPYNFLCRRGDAPVTWSTSQLKVYSAGLTAPQAAALPLALSQWQVDGGFTVTMVNASTSADVTIRQGALVNLEYGYTSVHYSCANACAFDHATVQLSSSAGLTDTLWVSTILHELGHVAGLSHVAQKSQVMYPLVTATSPGAYSSGDKAGFKELARIRAT
jgi:hypothetical protein